MHVPAPHDGVIPRVDDRHRDLDREIDQALRLSLWRRVLIWMRSYRS